MNDAGLQMTKMPTTAKYPPLRASVCVAGAVRIPLSFQSSFITSLQAGRKMSDRDFSFDVRDYVAGSQKTAAHLCTLPATNGRFVNKVPLPVQGRLINIVGSISGAAAVANGDDNIKRVPVEVDEITFLAADGSPTSPVVVSGTVIVNLCSLALRHYRKEIKVLGVFDNSSSCSSSAS